MSEMIERVASAIAGALSGHLSVAMDGEKVARAAIQAMREPTDKMLHAATMQVPTWDNDASRRKWQAMVDVALSLQDSQP